MKTPYLLTLIAMTGLLASCGVKKETTAGKFTIIDTLTDDADETRAKSNAEDALVRYPNLNAMVGLYGYNPPACLEAVKGGGGNSEVQIFGFDELDATLQGIKDGEIEGTVVQQPYEFGYQSVKYLKEIADGKQPDVPGDKIVGIPAKVITKENVDAFWKKLKAQSQAGKDAAKSERPKSETKFAFITNNPSSFWDLARAGCAKGEQDFGVRVEFFTPATGKATEQNRILEDILAKGDFDGVAITVKDPANQTEILNQVAAAMPLICHDSDAPKSNRLFYLGTKNYEAGKMLGEFMVERMPDGGSVMVFVGTIDSANATERRQGMIDAFIKGE
jgi:ribose transport system substrate-binding protein